MRSREEGDGKRAIRSATGRAGGGTGARDVRDGRRSNPVADAGENRADRNQNKEVARGLKHRDILTF